MAVKLPKLSMSFCSQDTRLPFISQMSKISQRKSTQTEKRKHSCLEKIKDLLLAVFCFFPHLILLLNCHLWNRCFNVATVTWAWKQKPAFPLNLLDVSIIKTHLTILVTQGKVLACIRGNLLSLREVYF